MTADTVVTSDYLFGGERRVVLMPKESKIGEGDGCLPNGEPPTWWNRVDPWWSGLYGQVGRGWTGKQLWADWHREGTPPVTEPAFLPRPAAPDWCKWPKPIPRKDAVAEHVRKVISFLHLQGIADDGAIAAVTGCDAPVVEDLWRKGVVEAAWFHADGCPDLRVRVWRMADTRQALTAKAQIVREGLSERYLISGANSGATVSAGIAGAMHQSMAVETCLRALETSDRWVGWAPERACLLHRIVRAEHPARTMSDKWALKSGPVGTARPDACLVRDDGARFYIEVQRTTGGIASHVSRWGELLMEGGVGGMVLYLMSPSNRHQSALAVKDTRKAIEQTVPAEVKERILVGAAMDYAPDLNRISKDAATLRCSQWGDGRWREVQAVDIPIPDTKGIDHILTTGPQMATWPTWASNPPREKTLAILRTPENRKPKTSRQYKPKKQKETQPVVDTPPPLLAPSTDPIKDFDAPPEL